jgi:hypothetical protein
MRSTPIPSVDIGALFPELAEKARFTTRLHPRRGTQSDPHGSMLGGNIAWPTEEPWPYCKEHKTPFLPVLQLNALEVPALLFPRGKDLLQILWCPNDHAEVQYAPLSTLFWRDTRSLTHEIYTSPKVTRFDEWNVPKSCIFHPEVVKEYPPIHELSYQTKDAIKGSTALNQTIGRLVENSEIEWTADYAYQCLWSVADGSKVGGHVNWIQDPEIPECKCGRAMIHLLTIASTEFDGASHYRWCPEEDASCWTADYDIRNAVQSASKLMLGDMGSIYFFVCTNCEGWPVQTVMQGS